KTNPTQPNTTQHTFTRTHAAAAFRCSHLSTSQPANRAFPRHAATCWPSAAAARDGGREESGSLGKKNAPKRRLAPSVQGIERVFSTSALMNRLNFVWLIACSRLRWHHSRNIAYRDRKSTRLNSS